MKQFIVIVTEKAVGRGAGIYSTIRYHEADTREEALANVDAWLAVQGSRHILLERAVIETEYVQMEGGERSPGGPSAVITPSGRVL